MADEANREQLEMSTEIDRELYDSLDSVIAAVGKVSFTAEQVAKVMKIVEQGGSNLTYIKSKLDELTNNK